LLLPRRAFGAKRVLEIGLIQNEARPWSPGDVRGLAGRVGSPPAAALCPVLAGLTEARVVDLASLQTFLQAYQAEVLVPIELAVIQHAAQHAHRGETRELLALDRALERELRLSRFTAASQAVGRGQLWRLLPLRDVRLIRRYWEAVEAGQAKAWHPLVYGVTLSVFSIPLRQGLLHYSGQILGGFLAAASSTLRLPADDRAAVAADLDRALPGLVARSLLAPEPLRTDICLLPLPPS